ncbi:Ran-binding domain-containing protein [Aspergillus brunneoviolaceus CBS 621.78]|uniref:Uncharacterized protein n=1 Tax=Aspergillus brunneoviolaceus CBS 621.78 TaxID=1450534 RepID=A0ACD1FU91_9EURO|nr:hypothetical protein BO95DRAFT_297304 [Aspergillus brunneoviolaceus CBS 621.78]RAH40538.1 hypothetical protein BO95DRAFT_297304 [Aspergillus brunneoviolaceus CBS 621.78]
MAPEQQHAGGAQVEEVPQPSISAQVADDSQASDNDGGERPVRNKLKETSITSVSKADDDAGPQEGETSRASSRGRKRSFDEDQPEKMDEDSGHRRKRSRDSNTEEGEGEEESNVVTVDAPSQSTEDLSRKILSPKKKRSRDQLDKDEAKPAETTEPVDQSTTEKEVATEKSAAEGEPEKKRHRDDSQEREKASIPSEFANTSAVSPFGVLGASKQESSDPSEAKSSSAFAASSMAAFAKSEQSPFGTLGSSTSSSIFKSSTPSDSSKPAATGFASAAGGSGFASLGSGFAGFSGGFGSAAPKSALTSFASPAAPSVLGSSKPSAFGQPEDDEKEGEAEEADAGPAEFEQDKTDERFFERPIETGEENEKTYFSCKAKLFQFSNKEWKERGIGTFKVNVRLTDGVEDKKAARMIMRADGVLRVMLNTPIFKGMTVGDAKGQPPKSKQIHLASLEEGRSVPLLLRTGSEELANELYNVVKDLQSHQ